VGEAAAFQHLFQRRSSSGLATSPDAESSVCSPGTVKSSLARLPDDVELLIFRLVQESLTNIHRHSGSKTAVIRVARRGDRISVEVQDQGEGISRERLAEIQSQGAGVGITGMRERIRQFQRRVNNRFELPRHNNSYYSTSQGASGEGTRAPAPGCSVEG